MVALPSADQRRLCYRRRRDGIPHFLPQSHQSSTYDKRGQASIGWGAGTSTSLGLGRAAAIHLAMTKNRIDASNCEQPVLRMMPGVPGRRTCNYVRHGTASLLAALDIASGSVIGKSQIHPPTIARRAWSSKANGESCERAGRVH